MTQFKTSLFAIYTALTREKQLMIAFDNIVSCIKDMRDIGERGQEICDDSVKALLPKKRENGNKLSKFA